LGIGTATFIPGYGLATGRSADHALLRTAIDRGVGYIDTAAAYGASEAALGEVADQLTLRAVRVCTKIQPANHTAPDFEAAARASLSRLRQARIDTMLLHSVSGAAIADDALADAWSGLIGAGLTAKTGASTYGAEDALLAAAAPWCDVLQIEYSILNQSVLQPLLETATRPRQEVVARSVLCKGLLTRAAAGLALPVPAVETIRGLETLAAQWDMDLATLAIRFALDTPGIDIVLVGVSNAAELDVAVGAWRRTPLSAEDYAKIAAFDRSSADWAHPERWPGGSPAACVEQAMEY
jgi:aryl-alcohol dehydrogenase-like predicted oxidoreductase